MNNSPLPLPNDNPTGLHGKYLIKKYAGTKRTGLVTERPVFKNVDPGSEYFILRLDDGCKDKVHLEACKAAVLHYAELIKDHLPKLSRDIKERYGYGS